MMKTLSLPTNGLASTPSIEELNFGRNKYVTIRNLDELHRTNIPVSSVPIATEEYGTYYRDGDWKAVKDAVNGDIYNVAKNYTVLPQKDVLGLVESLCTKGFYFKKATMKNRSSFRYDLVYPMKMNLSIKEHSKDFDVVMGFRIENSYDGSSGFRIKLMGMLNVCQNIFGLPTAFVKSGLNTSINKRHTKAVLSALDDAKWIDEGIGTFTKIMDRGWRVRSYEDTINVLDSCFQTQTDHRHPMAVQVIEKSLAEKYGTADFNLFMAATALTTHHDDLKVTHREGLEKFSESFFLN